MKRLMQSLRTLHLYLSMLGFVLIAFFALSGVMLNHEEWFKPDELRSTRVSYTSVPYAMAPAETAREEKLPADAQRKIEERLRGEFHLRGALKDPIVSADRVDFIFESPGRTVTVTIPLVDDPSNPRGDRKATVRDESTGLIGRLCEMHKKTTKNGAAWRLLVDGTAIVVLITSLTGLFLWMGTFKRRWLAALALASGAVLFALAYAILLP